ncbi:MAG: AAA family ATPase [Parvularcula sp.]|jgi:wobble nucleotide-excising tRNase|nr:AAA family ATPase [Parvularcula sp.]
MAGAANNRYRIKARCLGPIIGLDVQLSNRSQNLIFARNGTGKSFLARAFRCLDLHGQGVEQDYASAPLVSDEAPDGCGSFEVHRGEEKLGQLKLAKETHELDIGCEDTIFHVFSEDYVQSELRSRAFKINDEIEHVIAVDSSNIELDEALEEMEEVRERLSGLVGQFQRKFDAEKLEVLKARLAVNPNLAEYRGLRAEELLTAANEKPNKPARSLKELQSDNDQLKALPSEPELPAADQSLQLESLRLADLTETLQRVTSPSSVADVIKEKIEGKHGFIETGLELMREHDPQHCPFCEQAVVGNPASHLLDEYVRYFDDEEERHRKRLRGIDQALQSATASLQTLKGRVAAQSTRFDRLKAYVPSQREVELDLCEDVIDRGGAEVASLRQKIVEKLLSLRQPMTVDVEAITKAYEELEHRLENNGVAIEALIRAVQGIEDERRQIQRNACTVFKIEFAIANWPSIEEIVQVNADLLALQAKVAELERENPSADAKERVAETFELLIRGFFADKYCFDREAFVLKRGERDMPSADRTLSDGEKTVIAFCYFVSSIHLKVKSTADYAKLFIVFDDPVTSMSYDYVYSIVQILRHLSLSIEGGVSTNPSSYQNNGPYQRPRLIVLPHSAYFFNVSVTNNVVKGEAAFALSLGQEEHSLTPLREYVAPFRAQLSDVVNVANGGAPNHHTGNAVRSVLEAVGRFCRPDKFEDSLTKFITFLASEDNLPIRSVLINSMSHGTFLEETPSPEDIRLACEETVEVVKRYASGQLAVVTPVADASQDNA